jgi:hypothetical protein
MRQSRTSSSDSNANRAADGETLALASGSARRPWAGAPNAIQIADAARIVNRGTEDAKEAACEPKAES